MTNQDLKLTEGYHDPWMLTDPSTIPRFISWWYGLTVHKREQIPRSMSIWNCSSCPMPVLALLCSAGEHSTCSLEFTLRSSWKTPHTKHAPGPFGGGLACFVFPQRRLPFPSPGFLSSHFCLYSIPSQCLKYPEYPFLSYQKLKIVFKIYCESCRHFSNSQWSYYGSK